MALAFFKFLFVNLGFIFLICYMVVSNELKKIKQQWPLYRCNPTYMFLADNIAENYKYCLSQTGKLSFDKFSLDLSNLQEKGFNSQYNTNKNFGSSIKANNAFGGNVGTVFTDFITKGSAITTIGTLFGAQFTGIVGNLVDTVSALSNVMVSGTSGLGVLDNTFAGYLSWIDRVS